MIGLGASLLALVLLCACDQPPLKEVAAAEGQLEQARRQGAEAYAPERLKEAEAALQRARSKVQERDYRAALSAAMEAAERARSAAQSAVAARSMTRGAVETAQTEVEAALDEVSAVREEAGKAKVPGQAFAALEPQVEGVRQGLKAVAGLVEKGDLLAAEKACVELKKQAQALPEAFREARAAWETAHPRGRRALRRR
jgi:chaperonin cofactor prefoldin